MVTVDEQGQNLLRPVNAKLVPETGYLVLNLEKQAYGFIDQPILFQGRAFQPKSELHITIISQDAETVARHLINDLQALAPLQALVNDTDWRFRKLPAYYHVVEAPGVETIIQMVEIPQMTAFFRALSAMIGRGFVLPPSHVTLYTRGTQTGIGLPTQAVFQSLVKGAVRPEEIQIVDDGPGGLGADQGLA